jgi:hypothetical protein
MQLTRPTLVTAWHTLRANSYAACLFGMTRDVAELISAVSLTKIEFLVRQLHRHLRPRWEDQPAIWRHLLLAAQTEDMRSQRALCLRSIRLLRAIRCVRRSQHLRIHARNGLNREEHQMQFINLRQGSMGAAKPSQKRSFVCCV